MARRLLAALLLLGFASRVQGADEPAADAVAQALDRGGAWVKARLVEGVNTAPWSQPTELMVLTLAHCGVTVGDKAFSDAVEVVASTPPRFTYRASLKAMALTDVNPRRYQRAIAHVAQWLVDTQLPGGEWGYPGLPEGSYVKTEGVTISPPEPPVEAGEEPADPERERRVVSRWVLKRRPSPAGLAEVKGDFSNTQFALLGLRAAREAGIEVPKETWTAALGYLRKFQQKDGGWGYVLQGAQDEASYASLTCAGIASTALCVAATGGGDPKADAGVRRGLAWLRKHLDFEKNAGIDRSSIVLPRPWQYYHLYSLERTARILNLKEVEGKAWYPLGARWLLARQAADGSWVDEDGPNSRHPHFQVADTCFALLFLTRATRPLTGR